MKLILTCEHGGNDIPKPYRSLFKGKESLLQSHRGYDPGTLDLFKDVEELASFSKSNTISRLLIELNRSLHHPRLFSEISKPCGMHLKKELINTYYLPYRLSVEKEIEKEIEKNNKVLHLSLHSFAPQLNGEVRNCDIGLLYDPKREAEKQFCREIKLHLKELSPSLKIRYNYPYSGSSDGFTTYLRNRFPEN